MDFKLFASDIDGTLLGNAEATYVFKKSWNQMDRSTQPLLCYNTGRLLDGTFKAIYKEGLPEPDYIISGIGTSIYDYSQQRVLKEFSEILEEGWNLANVERVIQQLNIGIVKQPDYLQNDYTSSWFLDDATFEQLSRIERVLNEAGIEAHVIYSSARFLDILPKWANKGNALLWLLKHLNIQPEQVIVAGDSGNDSAMFLIKGISGIIVGNAQPELYQTAKHLPVFHAGGIFADGIIEGLLHYGVFYDVDRTYEPTPPQDKFAREIRQLVNTDLMTGLDEDQNAFITLAYYKAIEALKKNITPLGFSACSLEDNEVRGTDENYRSVWARDGSITILGSLSLVGDEALRQCQQHTFETLLNHITPNGQIPANVRIDDERPDYSGVGGICSIDSSLWVIIAFYEYINTTRDLNFLRKYFGSLQLAMNWLSAHDGNNDALLEIPEAGDWTDLFGRSYNVLYDEVLWYRANICFGRLLELLGDEKRAGDYLRWSQIIKKEIINTFWPSTKQKLYQAVNFAEQQYSLGDACYLIAQVTPFDFSWRCDVYGNLLAFLLNVIDIPKAQLAFRFMWGVGINDPYPVANLYPVVTAGDQDWKRYYTVNLLNLPHHYHNGGIWPFIGAQWVRFINKLGLRPIALQELYKLAALNKLGVHNDWEFNEWAHGETGRPMGKIYQAWSASGFILACHDLKLVQ